MFGLIKKLFTKRVPTTATHPEYIPPSIPELPQYRNLGEDELVRPHDEWRLIEGIRHLGGRPVMWRPTTDDSWGKCAGYFTKSVFRRPLRGG